MKRIATMVTIEQHAWLMEQKKSHRVTLEANIREALDLFIKKKNREAKR